MVYKLGITANKQKEVIGHGCTHANCDSYITIVVAAEANEESFVDFRLRGVFLYGLGRRLRHSLYYSDFFLSYSVFGHCGPGCFKGSTGTAGIVRLWRREPLGLSSPGEEEGRVAWRGDRTRGHVLRFSGGTEC